MITTTLEALQKLKIQALRKTRIHLIMYDPIYRRTATNRKLTVVKIKTAT